MHDEYQLCLSLNWPGEYDYRGTYYRVPAGSLSVIQPGEMHAARDLADRQTHARVLVMYASPDMLQSIAAPKAYPSRRWQRQQGSPTKAI